jgi:DnaJ-class molecular chaperone
MSKSLYDVLGVPKQATQAEIRKAYLKLARVHHPDKGGDADKFKEITQASDVLTDEKRRRLYDETGMTDEQAVNTGFPGGFPPGFPGGGFPFEFNMNDLFGNMFQGQRNVRKGRKPPPMQQNIGITLEQFYLGHQFNVNINRQCFCKECSHTGAKSKEVCKKCGGKGNITQISQMGPFAMHTQGPCHDCMGKGERVLEACRPCNGSGFINEQKNLTVKILPGTMCSEVVQFPEVCSDNLEFEQAGDVHIALQADGNDPAFNIFRRVGSKQQDLETDITLSLSESLMGCVVQIDQHPGYDEGLFIHLPPSFQGDTYCLKGFGMPLIGALGKHGDLFMKVNVVVQPVERKLFLSKGREALVSLFQDKIRPMKCEADAVQMEAELVSK